MRMKVNTCLAECFMFSSEFELSFCLSYLPGGIPICWTYCSSAFHSALYLAQHLSHCLPEAGSWICEQQTLISTSTLSEGQTEAFNSKLF